MARMNQGLFGGFTGRLGNLIGYTLNGQPLARTVGKISTPATLAQLAVRQTVAQLSEILSATLLFINSGFELEVVGTTKNPSNAAMSANFKATTGQYPYIQVDFSKLILSKGTLSPAVNASTNLLTDGIEFIWETDPSMVWGIGNDRTMLLLYFPGNNQSICILSGAQRREGRDFIPLNAEQLGQPMETYLAFVADDRKSVSDSVYTGRLN